MKVVIDACVLFPTVLRELVLDYAATGAFEPIWSARLLEEWRRAAARVDEGGSVIADSEIAVLKMRFPEAEVVVSPETEAGLSLPDPADVHVLCAAIDGQADVLMTLNLRDFPQRVLSAYGICAEHPDSFMWRLLSSHEAVVHKAVADTLQASDIEADRRRAVLKRAKLPRFAKALEASVGDAPALRG